MNYKLAKIISEHLYNNLEVVSLASGIVADFEKDKLKFPGAKDFCQADECKDKIRNMSPNSKESCIIFFKSGNYSSPRRESRRMEKLSTQLFMHVWINSKRIEECVQSEVMASIIDNLPYSVKAKPILKAIRTTYSKLEKNPYQGYKFAKDNGYNKPPYYGYVVTLNYEMFLSCINKVNTQEVC